jgi:hypothetical protein
MMDTGSHSLYEQAPELILDRLAEVNDVLQKQKAKTGETDSWKFWMKVSETLLFGWQYIQDLKFIMDRNRILEQENKFFKDYCHELSKRLEPYESIRRMKLKGTFEDTEKVVDQIIFSENKETRHPDNTK